MRSKLREYARAGRQGLPGSAATSARLAHRVERETQLSSTDESFLPRVRLLTITRPVGRPLRLAREPPSNLSGHMHLPVTFRTESRRRKAGENYDD